MFNKTHPYRIIILLKFVFFFFFEKEILSFLIATHFDDHDGLELHFKKKIHWVVSAYSLLLIDVVSAI